VLDAGMILIITAHELAQADLEIVRTAVDPDRIQTVWVGDSVTTDLACDLVLSPEESPRESLDRVKRLLQDSGVIFRCW
jgi:bifunctional enzyme CysN/CysC